MTDMDPNDFYEDDEPVEKIVAAFEQGNKVFTTPPRRGFNQTLVIPGLSPGPIRRHSPNQPMGRMLSSSS